MDAKQLGAGWQEGRMSDGNGLHHLTPPEIIIIIVIIIILLNSINIMVMINNRYCQMSGTHLIDVAGSPSCNLIDLDTQGAHLTLLMRMTRRTLFVRRLIKRMKMTIVPIV